MIKINEETIHLAVTSQSTINNGKKLCKNNAFTELSKDSDNTIIFGSCAGSGSSVYKTSVDFTDETQPVYRCSCPSRQIPCKHTVGLMLEYLNGKSFSTTDIPEDIQRKRTKASIAKEKKQQPKKVNKSALKKKMQKQLDMLNQLDTFIAEQLSSGISSLESKPIKLYEDFAKQLGNSYLAGLQEHIRQIPLTLNKIKVKKISSDIGYRQIIDEFILLNSISKKAKTLLQQKIESDNILLDNSPIFEELGTIWQLTELKELGLIQTNKRIMQLSFNVEYNETKKEYCDEGIWIDMDNGTISKTKNYRPLKALKNIKFDDSVFEILNIPELYYYPCDINGRIRFDGYTLEEIKSTDYEKIYNMASCDLNAQLKTIKNTLKNPISKNSFIDLIKFDTIGKVGEKIVLKQNDTVIELQDITDRKKSLQNISLLQDITLLKDNVLTGEFSLDKTRNCICIKPLSILTKNKLIRLMY